MPIREKGDRYVIMNIPAMPLARKMQEMGLGNRKTYDLDIAQVLKYVPKDLERHFLRGLFDGDGSICIYKYPYFKKHTYHIGFTGLKNVCDYVQDALGLKTKMQDEGKGFFTVRSTCRADAVRIGHYLYDDATIYIDRKYHTFQEVYVHAANDD